MPCPPFRLLPIYRLPCPKLLACLAILLTACKSPPSPDLSQQVLIQVALLLSYDHPSANRDLADGLERALAELNQIHTVVFGQAPKPAPLSKRQQRINRRKARKVAEVKPSIQSNYLAYIAWKKQQIEQIIEQGFDVLIVFGDEQIELDDSLRAARQAGLYLIYCGFSSKPLISNQPVANLDPQSNKMPHTRPYDYLYKQGPEQSILDQNSMTNHLPNGENRQGENIDSYRATRIPLNDKQSYSVPNNNDTVLSDNNGGTAVHVNIRPASIAAMVRSLEQFLVGSDQMLDARDPYPNRSVAADNRLAEQRMMFNHQQPPAVLLFGPSELPFTRTMYRNMRGVIRKHRDYIHAVRFLDPWRIGSQDELRNLAMNLPAKGRIIALEPLLFYSTAQLLQRYSLNVSIVGLGWESKQAASRNLGNSHNIKYFIPLHYGDLAYAALHVAFSLYSGQKQGRVGEYFLLGIYGQRQLGRDGSLVLHNFYSNRESGKYKYLSR